MKMLKIDPMIDDVGGLKGNISLNSPDSCLVRSVSNSPTQFSPKPISMLRNYHQNPMIGGPCMLASPTLTINNNNCQVMPSELPIITGSVNDVTRGSGMDDINMNDDNLCPLKDSFDLKGIPDSFSDNNIMLNPVKEYEKSLVTDKNELTPFTMLNGQPPPLENTMQFKDDAIINGDNIRSIVANDDNLDKSKHSRSLIDNNNPLMSPFLMDLCSDDYHMNTDEYLKESDIEIVLNEWPTELV
ncbi:hypothetical protein GQX74_015067 [Glossina fuscipes]|nr:hypothetical protein GQX74_015067 [Glossina fuscipes]